MTATPDISREEDLPILLSIDEAAGLLRCNVKHVYELARKRELPGARKVGGIWRIHRDTLLEWIRTGHED